MGRVLRKEVIAIRCQVEICGEEVPLVPPLPASTAWHGMVDQLEAMTEAGWGFVLHTQMRSYCPEHADRVADCTCRTHPARAHLCTSHNDEAAHLVWEKGYVPDVVTKFLEVLR